MMKRRGKGNERKEGERGKEMRRGNKNGVGVLDPPAMLSDRWALNKLLALMEEINEVMGENT